jgi:hypothetical protein
MRSTLLKWFLVPAVAAAAALASHTASAETVNVPFSFSAMGKAFPAGSYVVEEDLNRAFVTLSQKDGSNSLIRVLGPGISDDNASHVVLRFSITGDSYVLDSIQYRAQITPHMTKRHHKDQERVITSGQ